MRKFNISLIVKNYLSEVFQELSATLIKQMLLDAVIASS